MPSAAKSRRLPEPYTFFVERSLGAHLVAEVVRASCRDGECVEVHADHFAADAPDVEWLAEVGARGWVVLTKDSSIRTNAIEREALVEARVAYFALARGDLAAARTGEIFAAVLPRVRTVLRRFGVPVIGVVSVQAAVNVYVADGKVLKPPKAFRPSGRGAGAS